MLEEISLCELVTLIGPGDLSQSGLAALRAVTLNRIIGGFTLLAALPEIFFNIFSDDADE